MTKIKTSELTGIALDYAVAICEGGENFEFDGFTWGFQLHGKTKVLALGWTPSMSYRPSMDWSTGGPIVERERIGLKEPIRSRPYWSAFCHGRGMSAATPLIAVMRAFIASKLGDEVDVPKELL